MGKRKMSLQDAMEFVPDDLPDGAFWAMAHEIAGAEYGDAWDELRNSKTFIAKTEDYERTVPCPQCGKMFKSHHTMVQHKTSMVRNGTHERIHAVSSPQPTVPSPTNESP